MKKILIVLLVPLLFACSKDSSNDPVPYTTKYKVGHEVANLRFKFKATDWSKWQSIYDAKRITDWRWVLGKTEEYTFEGKIYERIIIVSEVQ